MTTESLAQSPIARPAAEAAVPTDAASAEAVRVDLAKAINRGATGIPPLLFVLPDGFHELPLQSDPAQRATAAEAFARELYPNGSEELWRTNAPAFAAMGEMTAATGVAYAAMGVFDNERGGVATVNLTIAATASDHTDPEVAATGLREILVRDEFNDSRWLNLPCGPAVSRITVTKFPLDPALTAGGAPAELVQGQIQVFVPFPTGPLMAIVTMGTFNMESWVEVSEMAAVLVQTLTFPRPGEEYEV